VRKSVKGKRYRGAGRKTPAFGILQQSGKVYTEIIPQIAPERPYRLLSEPEWTCMSYILTVGVVTTA